MDSKQSSEYKTKTPMIYGIGIGLAPGVSDLWLMGII